MYMYANLYIVLTNSIVTLTVSHQGISICVPLIYFASHKYMYMKYKRGTCFSSFCHVAFACLESHDKYCSQASVSNYIVHVHV